jgi:uncharacterized protein (DUF2336 family)
MDARELLHQFDAAGITVVAEAGNLIVRPASTLTTAHRQALRAAKQELLLLLAPVGDSSCLEEFEERAAIMEFDGGLRDRERFQERMLQRFLTQPQNAARDDVDYLLDRMDRISRQSRPAADVA